MSREREAYEDNLLRLKEFFPSSEILSAREVAKFAGKDVRTVKKIFPLANGYISVATLARAMSPAK